MITKLSEQQLAQIPKFVDRWCAIGLSTQPLDHRRFENQIAQAYGHAGRPEPGKYIWLQSPLQAAIAYLMLTQLPNAVESGWEEFGKSLGASLGFQLPAALEKLKASVSLEIFSVLTTEMADIVNGRVHDLVDTQIIETVMNSLPTSPAANEWDFVGEVLGETVKGINWKKVRELVLDDLPSLSTLVFRQGLGKDMPVGLRCLREYLSDVLGLTDPTALDRESPSTWWWPFEKICVVAERYIEINRDKEFRLHSEHGPSVKYPGGWDVYSYRGVVVPFWVIDYPQKVTTSAILNERNPEIRGVMLAKYGEDSFSAQAGVEVLSLTKYSEWAASARSSTETRMAIFRGRNSSLIRYFVRS